MNNIKYVDMLITKKFDAAEICVTDEWEYGTSADLEFIFMYNNYINDFYIPYWRVLDIKNGQLYRANERISGSTQTITINNTAWQWISFTFTGSEIELGAIQLQMYASSGSSTASGNYNYEVLLALAVLEEGTSFTGYRESPYEKLCINGKEPTAKVADNLFIQTCGAQC